MRRLALAFLGTVFSMLVHAGIDTYEFASEEQQAQFTWLTNELRCPKCQNQNIADSNAPLATDMRREVHRMVTEGASNDAVVAYMVERFGDFVSYRPRFDRTTFLLWFGPALVALVGVVWVLLTVRKRRPKTADLATLTDDERKRVRKLLGE